MRRADPRTRAGCGQRAPATPNNALEWNTIYNCWFDSTQAPPLGPVFIAEARIGAGALSNGQLKALPAFSRGVGGPHGRLHNSR